MSFEKFVVLMPLYNDWEALFRLLPALDRELQNTGFRVDILVVDDGSSALALESSPLAFEAINTIEVISLKRNLGHQRAIALGLSYIAGKDAQTYVIVMDADGEDDPRDVPRLINACIASDAAKIVFAARIKRSEGYLFTLGYHVYRLLHFILTGIRVRVGNFSIIPPGALKRLVPAPELWNHYAAAVHKTRLAIEVLPSERGRRLAGIPRMDLVALVVHGLSAMAVFGDRIGVRLLISVSLGMCVTLAALALVIGVRVATDFAIPGWATYAAGLLVVMLMQMLLVTLVFVFVILAARNAVNVTSQHDYTQLIGSQYKIYG